MLAYTQIHQMVALLQPVLLSN